MSKHQLETSQRNHKTTWWNIYTSRSSNFNFLTSKNLRSWRDKQYMIWWKVRKNTETAAPNILVVYDLIRLNLYNIVTVSHCINWTFTVDKPHKKSKVLKKLRMLKVQLEINSRCTYKKKQLIYFHYTAQKMKFSIKDFLWIWSHLIKKFFFFLNSFFNQCYADHN